MLNCIFLSRIVTTLNKDGDGIVYPLLGTITPYDSPLLIAFFCRVS
jgi:hypothetical protein